MGPTSDYPQPCGLLSRTKGNLRYSVLELGFVTTSVLGRVILMSVPELYRGTNGITSSAPY